MQTLRVRAVPIAQTKGVSFLLILLAALACSLAMASQAFAATIYEDADGNIVDSGPVAINYVIDTESNEVTIVSVLATTDYKAKYHVVIPEKLEGAPVAHLGDNAISGFTSNYMEQNRQIVSVSLPKTLKTIGVKGLYYVPSIKSVTFAEGCELESIGNTAFWATKISTIDLPDTVKTIGTGAFAYTNIESFEYPAAFEGTEVANQQFYGCSKLKQITLAPSMTQIGSGLNGLSALETVIFPEDCKITEIGNQAFYGCSALKELRNFPEGITKIDNMAFYSCSSLADFDIPSTVTYIGGNAFYGCSNLTDITIPKSLTSAGTTPFMNSGVANITLEEGLTYLPSLAGTKISGEFTIPSTVTSVGDSTFRATNVTGVNATGNPFGTTMNLTFYQCRALEGFDVPEGVTTLNQTFYGCTSLTEFDVPEGITTLGNSVFYGCTALEQVSLPDTVTSLGSQVFYGCTALAGIEVPDAVTDIPNQAFANCTALESFEIGENVTSIGSNAFSGCTALEEMTVPDNVISLGSGAFQNCTSMTEIHVGAGVGTVYPATFNGCSSLADIYVANPAAMFSATSAITGAPVTLAIHGWVLPDVEIAEGATDPFANSVENYAAANYVFVPFAVFSEQDFTYTYTVDGEDVTIDEPLPITATVVMDPQDMPEADGAVEPEPVVVVTDSNGMNYVVPSDAYTVEYANNGYDAISAYLADATQPAPQVKLIGIPALYAFGSGDYLITVLAAGEAADDNGIFTFEFDSGAKTAKVAGLTEAGLQQTDPAIPASVTKDGVEYAVTVIRSAAFQGNDTLNSVKIPESVTAIGELAFKDSGIGSIDVSASVDTIGRAAFSGCEGLESVVIRGDVELPASLFAGCTSLASLTCEGDVAVGALLCEGCESLETVEFKGAAEIGPNAFENTPVETVKLASGSIGKYVFAGCDQLSSLSLGEGVMSIAGYAFQDCSALEILKVPASVATLDSSAFTGCNFMAVVFAEGSQLQTFEAWFSGMDKMLALTPPDQVTSMADSALKDCSSLMVFTMPDTVTTVGPSTFENCSSLKKVTLSDNLTGTSAQMFWGCTNLNKLEIPLSVTSVASNYFNQYGSGYPYQVCGLYPVPNLVFDGESTLNLGQSLAGWRNQYDDSRSRYNTVLKSVVLPGKATTVNLQCCSALESVTLPSALTSIPDYALITCYGLKSITIPESVTSIGYQSFQNCTSLESITMPEGLQSIGYQAFYGTAVKSISLPSTLKTISNNAFSQTKLTSVNVPEGVTTVGSAFSSNDNLTSATMPSTVSSIYLDNCPRLASVTWDAPEGADAGNFNGDSRLGTYVIDEDVVSIQGSAFQNCRSLGNMVIPAKVATVQRYAFVNCSAMDELAVMNPTISFDATAFSTGVNPVIRSWDHEAEGNAKAVAEANGFDFVPFAVIGDYTYEKTAEPFTPEVNATVEVGETVAYNANGAQADIAAACGERELVVGEDLIVTYQAVEMAGAADGDEASEPEILTELVEPGTYTVTIAGNEESFCFGTVTATVTVEDPGDITAATVEATSPHLTNDGNASAPEVTVTFGEGDDAVVLVEGEDYALAYQDSEGNEIAAAELTQAGDYKAVATGIGHYTGKAEAPFALLATCDLAQAAIAADDLWFRTGDAALAPSATVTATDGTELKAGVDYELVMTEKDGEEFAESSISLPGSYKVKAVAKEGGICTAETAEVVFEAADAADAAGASVEATDPLATGSAVAPEIEVSLDGKKLVEGEDYDLVYYDAEGNEVAAADLAEPGEYTAVAKFKNGYEGESKPVSFKVLADIANATVIAADSALNADGIATTDVTVTVGEGDDAVALVEGADYTLSYGSNDRVGTATVTVTGIGSYGGTTTATFEVAEQPSHATELSGDSRFGTAAAIANAAYPDGADTIVVANGFSFADALSATALAGALDAPIVTVNADALPAETIAAIRELGATKAYVIGGTSAVSDSVASQIGALVGSEPVRVSGDDRYATSMAIYDAGEGSWGDTAIIAVGTNFADAVSVGPFANAEKAPIILSDGSTLSAEAQAALKSFKRVIIVGGPGVVSEDVENLASSIVGDVVRLAGSDRYETSAIIGEWLVANAGFSYDNVAFATGAAASGGADALTGGVLQGKAKAVLLLTDPETVPDPILAIAAAQAGKVSSITYLGSDGAVKASARAAINEAFGWNADGTSKPTAGAASAALAPASL